MGLSQQLNRRIGVAGAKGFIGSSLVPHLRGLGVLRTLDRSLPVESHLFETVEVILGDLLSPKDCTTFVSGLDVVFYLAHRNTDTDFPSDSMLNSLPILNLIQAIRGSGKKTHVVYFSSGGAIYGNSNGRVPFKETDPCTPLSSYGIQKLFAEHYLRLAAQQGILTATVLRVGNAYGKLLPTQRMQGLIGVALSNVVNRKPITVFGDPNNIRDYIHLDDICSICEKTIAPVDDFAIFNVANHTGYSVSDVLSLIERLSGKRFTCEPPRDIATGVRFPDWCVLDITKARETFQWAPKVSLSEGITRMLSVSGLEPATMAETTGQDV